MGKETYKTIKLKVSGWIEEGEQYSNVPKICEKCGSKLRVTDALSLCNILMVWCPKSICRWCLIFEQ